MFVFRGFFFGLFFIFRLDFGFAVPIYGTFGGSVDLNPGHTSSPITSVTWKHKTDLALEWFGDDITCYRTFKGRCNLNKETGSFRISNLTSEDSGEYTPEMNNVVGATMELKVIKPVPKPTVSVDCNSEKTDCNLTCEANINAECGPVTYEWKSGDTKLSRNKELSITAENEESSFYCKLINPVSSSISDEISDPISRGNIAAVIISVVVAVLGLVVIGAFLLLFFLNRAGHFPFFDKLFPCNEKERTRKRDARQSTDDNSETVQIGLNPDVNAAPGEADKLLRIEDETNQDQVAVTPNGGFHPVSQENDQENAKAEEELSRLLPDPQTTAEIKSKGKEALNGPANVNDDGMNNFHQTVDQQQQQDPPAEQVCDDEGESGQKSKSEETEPTTEGPEKPKDPTCDTPVDSEPEQGSSQESNLDPPAVNPEPSSQTEDISMDEEALHGANVNGDGTNNIDQIVDQQQQQDPPAEQVCDDEGESGQKSKSEETEPTTEGPEKPKDPTCDTPVDSEPEQGSSQESNLDPPAVNPEPSSQTEDISMDEEALHGANVNGDGTNNIDQIVDQQQQQDPPAEQVCDDEGESGQKSKSEETEPTTEGPEKPKDPTCDTPVDSEPEQGSSQESNLDPPAVNPEPSSQTDTLQTGTSLPKPRNKEMHDTDSAES